MASIEEGSETHQYNTWVLKVSINCEGCKNKVRKILQKVDGVSKIEIDSQSQPNKVTVTGNVEAETLIRKLLKSGKTAELWPVEKKKPNNPNPNPNPNPNNSNVKGKDAGIEKQKDASESNEPNEKIAEKPPEKSSPATKPETDTKQAETAAPAGKINPATKPADTDTKSIAGTEVSGSSRKETSKPDPKTKQAPASSESETRPSVTKSNSGKKKGKKEAEVAGNEGFVMNSGGAPAAYQVHAAYPQTVYTASYNMVHPTASHSYYDPIPTMPQSYMYTGHPPPPPEYYPHYPHYPPPSEYYPQHQHYQPPPENYYSPMELPAASSSSSQSQGSYDFLNDENANSCNVM